MGNFVYFFDDNGHRNLTPYHAPPFCVLPALTYTGEFQPPWGAPTMWIRYDSAAPMQISNLTATPAANTIWYTSAGPYHYNQNLTHYIALEFPAGIVKGVTYTGVTIWILVRND